MDKRFWVDIPSGWQHGWPKVWNQSQFPDFSEWLKAMGCPPLLQNMAEQYSRMWPVNDTDEEI